jgi:hypothetical protein
MFSTVVKKRYLIFTLRQLEFLAFFIYFFFIYLDNYHIKGFGRRKCIILLFSIAVTSYWGYFVLEFLFLSIYYYLLVYNGSAWKWGGRKKAKAKADDIRTLFIGIHLVLVLVTCGFSSRHMHTIFYITLSYSILPTTTTTTFLSLRFSSSASSLSETLISSTQVNLGLLFPVFYFLFLL